MSLGRIVTASMALPEFHLSLELLELILKHCILDIVDPVKIQAYGCLWSVSLIDLSTPSTRNTKQPHGNKIISVDFYSDTSKPI